MRERRERDNKGKRKKERKEESDGILLLAQLTRLRNTGRKMLCSSSLTKLIATICPQHHRYVVNSHLRFFLCKLLWQQNSLINFSMVQNWYSSDSLVMVPIALPSGLSKGNIWIADGEVALQFLLIPCCCICSSNQ